MATKKEHQDYLKKYGKFMLDGGDTFYTKKELDILTSYGHWFRGLTNGDLEPLNPEQERFVQVAKGEKEAETPHEKVWLKFLSRKKLMDETPERFNARPTIESDPFYDRDMAKQQRRIMFGVMRKNHRE